MSGFRKPSTPPRLAEIMSSSAANEPSNHPFREEIREIYERHKRSSSVIVRGVDVPNNARFVKVFNSLTRYLLGTSCQFTDLECISKDKKLYRLKIVNDAIKKSLLEKAKSLKNSSYAGIYINRDLTYAQRQELARRRQTQGCEVDESGFDIGPLPGPAGESMEPHSGNYTLAAAVNIPQVVQDPGRSMMSEEVEEHGVRINIHGTFHAPKKNEVMYNSEMLVNRSLVLCALAAYYESGLCTNTQVRCLDALGATGVSGLAWAKHLPKVDVVINDQSPAATERITANTAINHLQVNITAEDVSVLLLQRPFDFVFLDCYGSSVHYLDAAFRNAPKHSMLAITSTDDSALYGKAADVTLRNYGGYVVKTSYAKELAARLVLGSVVRAAAKSNKGVEVVCCVALKSFITVVVRVLRGPAAANRCVRKIRRVIHCCVCEDRAFYPETVYPIEEPYSLLSCECRSKSDGKLAVELGPVWCDEIFDTNFCQAMLTQANNLQLPHKVTSLLQTIVNEAKCRGEPGPDDSVGGDKENTASEVAEERSARLEEEEEDEEEEGSHHHSYHSTEEDHEGERSPKKFKTHHPALKSPAFYFNLHRHSPKGHDLGKINKVVEYLQRAHHKASRTHFDPEAIRTSCTLREFTRLLQEFSQAQN